MIQPNIPASEALTLSSQKIAAKASEHFIADNPDIEKRYEEDPYEHWKDHFSDRITDLSESIAAGSPQIFTAHLQWADQALSSRGLNTDHLLSALKSLKVGLETFVPEEMRKPVLECFNEAFDRYTNTAAPTWESALDPGLPLDRLALHYLQMVMSGNVWAGMQVVIDALDEGYSVKDLFVKVLLPAQAEVGRLWHLNEMTVAEEHMVSTTTQRLMAVLANHADRKSDRGVTAIATAVAGNVHDIGIRTIAYLMEFEGWKTIFLGSDMPRSELPSTVKYFEADIVLLSIGLTTQLKSLKKTINDIREKCGSDVKIMIGGNGLKETPDLWQHIGADGYAADLDDALEQAALLVA